jgi:hypothetical protein
MPGGRKPLHKRDEAVSALLESGSVAEAAERCGVSERTLRNWLADPPFLAAYKDARRKLLDDAVLRLQHAAKEAVATLVRHLGSDNPNAAIRAAVAILDQTFRGTEVLDLANELAELRKQVEASQHGNSDAGAGGQSATGGALEADAGGGAATGEAEGGPGEDTPDGEDAAGCLASGVAPLDLATDAAVVLAAGGQKPGGGGFGAA